MKNLIETQGPIHLDDAARAAMKAHYQFFLMVVPRAEGITNAIPEKALEIYHAAFAKALYVSSIKKEDSMASFQTTDSAFEDLIALYALFIDNEISNKESGFRTIFEYQDFLESRYFTEDTKPQVLEFNKSIHEWMIGHYAMMF